MSVNKKFSIKSNGYDVSEVDKFLKVVTVEYEKLVNKNVELDTTISLLNSQLAKFNAANLYNEEIDSFIKSKREYIEKLDNEINEKELKLDLYKDALDEVFHRHLDLIEKLK